MKLAYIDNRAFPIKEGETILSFVRRHKGESLVPTLCDAPNLDPFGSCRVCSVEVALEHDGKDQNNGFMPYACGRRAIYLPQYAVGERPA